MLKTTGIAITPIEPPFRTTSKPLKMKTYFKFLPAVLLFAACEKDDAVVNNGTPGLNASGHAQFAVGNYWVYQGHNIDPNTGDVTVTNMIDSITIVKDTTINGELYYQFKGDHYGAPSLYRNLRIDGARIVDEHGRVYMDLEAEQDTVEIMPGWSVVDSAARVMHSAAHYFETPTGNYTSDAWHEVLLYIQSPFPSPQSEFEYYVDGLGVAMYSATYVSSQVRIEMRLTDYSIQ